MPPPPRRHAFGAPLWIWLILLALLGTAANQRGRDMQGAVKALGNPATYASDGPIYAVAAGNLRYGLGMLDLRQVGEFSANPMLYRSHPTSDPARLRGYYQNDVGLSVIFWAAIHLFGNSDSPLLLLLWLQVLTDTLNVLLAFWIGNRLAGPAAGLAAAALYATFSPVIFLASTFPYYYYWAGCFSLWTLGLGILVTGEDLKDRPPAARIGMALAYGLTLGLAAMVRSNFLMLGIMVAGWMLLRWRGHWRMAIPLAAVMLAAQLLVLSPVFWRSYQRFGRLTPPRLIWHTVYVGIGARPNPYGITWNDAQGRELMERRGLHLSFGAEDPGWIPIYEKVLREEVMRIWRAHPDLLLHDAALNIVDGFTSGFAPLGVRAFGGEIPLAADVGRQQILLAALILLQMAWFHLRLRTAARAAAWWPTVLQGVYFVVGVSLLAPPYLAYNSCYYPTLIMLLAVAAAAIVDGAGLLMRIPFDRYDMALAGAAAVPAMASLVNGGPLPVTWAGLQPLSLCLAACVLRRLLGRWVGGWPGTAAAVGLVMLGVVFRGGSLLQPAHALQTFGTLLGGLLVAAMYREADRPRVPLLALAAFLSTGLTPQAALLPLALIMLLDAAPVPPYAARFGGWCAGFGVAAVVACLPFGRHLNLTVILIPIAFWLLARALSRRRGPGWARAGGAAGLALIHVSGYAAWPMVAGLTVAAWGAARLKGWAAARHGASIPQATA